MAGPDSPPWPFLNRTPPQPFGDTSSESALTYGTPAAASANSAAILPRYLVHGANRWTAARDPERDHIPGMYSYVSSEQMLCFAKYVFRCNHHIVLNRAFGSSWSWVQKRSQYDASFKQRDR